MSITDDMRAPVISEPREKERERANLPTRNDVFRSMTQRDERETEREG